MRVDIILADSAQTDPGGKAHILGAGWSIQNADPTPMAIVVFVEVAWDEANAPLTWQLELLDGDGRRVQVPGPVGPQEFAIGGRLEAGRPAGLPKGTPLGLPPLAINLMPLPLAAGRYEWRFSIDGESQDTWHRSFTKLLPVPGASEAGMAT